MYRYIRYKRSSVEVIDCDPLCTHYREQCDAEFGLAVFGDEDTNGASQVPSRIKSLRCQVMHGFMEAVCTGAIEGYCRPARRQTGPPLSLPDHLGVIIES